MGYSCYSESNCTGAVILFKKKKRRGEERKKSLKPQGSVGRMILFPNSNLKKNTKWHLDAYKDKNLFSKGSTTFPVGANQPSRWVNDEGNPCSIINIFNN